MLCSSYVHSLQARRLSILVALVGLCLVGPAKREACAVPIPSNVANLELWLQADSGPMTSGSPSVPGDTVDTWVDNSGTFNDGTGLNTPILRSRNFNSKTFPVVEFSGGGDRFTTANTNLSNAAGSTYFVVFSTQNQSNGNGRFISANGTGNRNLTAFSNQINSYDGTNSYSFSANIQNSDFHIATLRAQPNLPEVLLDGVANPLGSTVGGGPFPNYNIGTQTALRVGADLGGGNSVLGDIAELLIYDRPLTDDEINSVGYFLQDKFGIDGSFLAPPVPEPSTLVLLVISLPALARYRRRLARNRA